MRQAAGPVSTALGRLFLVLETKRKTDRRTLDLLEYDRLLEILAGMTKSEPGRDYCLELRPELQAAEIQESWRLIEQARGLDNVEGPPPLEGLVDIQPLLDRLAAEGLTLRPLELLAVHGVVRASRLVRSYLRRRPETAPGLSELAEGLPVYRELEEALGRSIGPEGEVLDEASPELARVRRELSGLRGAVQSKLTQLMRRKEVSGALQDDLITRRAGRYVIPVQASRRREVPGLVHDYSSSGATAYVEPLDMVEDNNKLNLLRRREKQEVERVLARLSAMAASASENLDPAQDLLARIDGIFAQAEFSRRQRALAPFFEEDGRLELRSARHPLLSARLAEIGEKAAPLDIRLERDKRLLVISGINAGGKTVALKTLGLLALMTLTGLHLPVEEGSTVRMFDRVMASMGDEQDLQSDLSTFSGHVRRLGGILSSATDRSLVLLDELGTGTDPAEGAALALAVLDELRDKGAWVLTATHYHLLKAWGRLTDGAENAAVRTDTDGRPMYGLEYGAPGFSAGLAMARGLGLDSELVARAEGYLDEGQRQTLDLMQKLEEERAALAQTEAEAAGLREELALALVRSKAEEKERAAHFEKRLADLQKEVNQAVRRAEREFNRIKRDFKASSEEKGRQSARRQAELSGRQRETVRELRAVLPMRYDSGPPLGSVNPGDRVSVAGLGREGRVVSLGRKNDEVEVDLGGMKVWVKPSDLVRPGPTAPRKRPPVRVTLPSVPVEAASEVNLLGLTVDEALPEVEKLLDQALLGGLKYFTIIHGIGTGRLRQAVRGYLTSDRRVKEFRAGEPRDGGEGVTLVELKD